MNVTPENPTPEATPEVVEQPQAPATEEVADDGGSVQTSEPSPEEKSNKAFKEMRKELSELKKMYDGVDPEEYRKVMQEREQSEQKKKLQQGKYEEVIKELQDKQSDYDKLLEFKKGYDERQTKKLTDMVESIPQDKRDFVSKIIDGKDVDDQINIIDEYLKEVKGTPYKANPKSDSPSAVSSFDQAKANYKQNTRSRKALADMWGSI